MKKHLKFGIAILLISAVLSCKKQDPDFKFYACEFDQSQYNDPQYYSKWISNKEEAHKTKLTFYDSDLNKRNLDSLYKETVQYLFIIGGGGIYVRAEDCEAAIKNDTIVIKYEVNFSTGAVGEAASTLVCLEINKNKYPNYKKMKVSFVDQDL